MRKLNTCVQYARPVYSTHIDNNLYKTFEGQVDHPVHGLVFCIIHRSVRNDSGPTRKKTVDTLKAHEPNVGFWDGDWVQYFDSYGTLVEERR